MLWCLSLRGEIWASHSTVSIRAIRESTLWRLPIWANPYFLFSILHLCVKRVNQRTKELWEMRQKLSNCNNINGLWHKFWNCKRMVRWMKAGVREDLSWRDKVIAHRNERQDLGVQCLYFAVNTLCLSFSVWSLSIFLPLYINPCTCM